MHASLGLVAALAVIALSSATAHADVMVVPPVHYKNRVTAAALSLGATVASNVVLVAGLSGTNAGDLVKLGLLGDLVAPSAGEWYAGHYLTLGLGLRVGGAALCIAGLYGNGGPGPYSQAVTPPHEQLFEAMLITGGLMVAAGTLWDIVDAPTSADRYNERVTITPVILPTPSGIVPGAGIGGTF